MGRERPFSSSILQSMILWFEWILLLWALVGRHYTCSVMRASHANWCTQVAHCIYAEDKLIFLFSFFASGCECSCDDLMLFMLMTACAFHVCLKLIYRGEANCYMDVGRNTEK